MNMSANNVAYTLSDSKKRLRNPLQFVPNFENKILNIGGDGYENCCKQ